MKSVDDTFITHAKRRNQTNANKIKLKAQVDLPVIARFIDLTSLGIVLYHAASASDLAT